jgi:hypothetical protein
MLIMCSARFGSDEFTARARISGAAVRLIGPVGFEAVTIRMAAGPADVFIDGLYTSTRTLDRHPEQAVRGDIDAPVVTPGRPRRTEPNAPAGDPPARPGTVHPFRSQPAA